MPNKSRNQRSPKEHRNKIRCPKDSRNKTQKGGTGSGYVNQWHAVTPSNIQTLSQYTADHLNSTPMFNPLRYNTKVATPTSGLIPTGVHLGNQPAVSNYYCHGAPIWTQGGGKTESNTNNWIDHVRHYARSNGISFKEAMSSVDCQKCYHRDKLTN